VALGNKDQTQPWTGIRRGSISELRNAPSVSDGMGTIPNDQTMLSRAAIRDFCSILFEQGSPSDTVLILGGHSNGGNQVVASFDLLGTAESQFRLARQAVKRSSVRTADNLLEGVGALPDSPTWLDPAELTSGLRGALGDAAMPLAVIGLDACCAASVELAYALQPYAEYFVASEIGTAIEGWDYKECLASALVGEIRAECAAEQIVHSFQMQHNRPLPAGEPDRAISSLKLDSLSELAASVARFVAVALDSEAPENLANVKQARTCTLLNDRSLVRVDMIRFFEAIETQTSVSPALGSRAKEAAACAREVVASTWANTPASASCRGLSVCFPALPGDFDSTWGDLLAYDAALGGFWMTSGWDKLVNALKA